MKNVIIATLTLIAFFYAGQNYQASHGDLNHDGKVDALDMSVLLSHWTK